MATQKPVTERDLRMPEFRHLNADDLDDYEIREDGKIVRKDRWENAIRSIRNVLGDTRREFEIAEVVSAVRALVASIEQQGDPCDTCDAFLTGCDDCSGYDNYIPIQIEPLNQEG